MKRAFEKEEGSSCEMEKNGALQKKKECLQGRKGVHVARVEKSDNEGGESI